MLVRRYAPKGKMAEFDEIPFKSYCNRLRLLSSK